MAPRGRSSSDHPQSLHDRFALGIGGADLTGRVELARFVAHAPTIRPTGSPMTPLCLGCGALPGPKMEQDSTNRQIRGLGAAGKPASSCKASAGERVDERSQSMDAGGERTRARANRARRRVREVDRRTVRRASEDQERPKSVLWFALLGLHESIVSPHDPEHLLEQDIHSLLHAIHRVSSRRHPI
jgi:hypothetical protein